MNIKKLTALIKLHEAGNDPELELYDDQTGKKVSALPSGGKATIGWGRNLSDCPISRAEAEFFLCNDIEKSIEDCERAFPLFDSLDEVRQAVLVDLAFNVGIGELKRWHHTLGAIGLGAWQEAHDHLLATRPWRSQVKEGRANRLADMLLTGEWPADLGD